MSLDAASKIKINDIRDIYRIGKWVETVNLCLKPMCILLGLPDLSEASQRLMLSEGLKFKDILIRYDTTQVSAAMLRKVQEFTSQAEYNYTRFKCCSVALCHMAEWTLAVE